MQIPIQLTYLSKESNGKVFEIKEKSANENKAIHLLLSLTL